MRLAFIDQVFTWPPLGGAPLDVYNTMQGLQDLGHEVHLFYGTQKENWVVDPVDESSLPFSATAVPYLQEDLEPAIIGEKYREAVDQWKPDIVFQCFGFFMKPTLTKALAHYPQIARYYAYEPFCPSNYRLFRRDKSCPKNYLRTPNACRRCTLLGMRANLLSGHTADYVLEYENVQGWSQHYYDELISSLKQYKSIIVYNNFTKELLKGVTDRVHVIGGGVHLKDFPYHPLGTKAEQEKTIIFLPGRAEDQTKGLGSLLKAGEILYKKRQDFEIWVTIGASEITYPWYKTLGWKNFSEIMALYQQSDICVVPSIWEEPFGLVAVEAMATGRPCIVADVGGLQEIVVPEETGYIYKRDNEKELAQHLETLLNDEELRQKMGDAGRKRVEDNYEWNKLIERHYPPILEEALS
ncbi:MAG: glycosyltransferase family 4 protein [Candidatus Hydrogenedens sp.]|jgi:glycosyltransferase involved in cell wall biosynthesis|nr:glycosyltransferase family 4 protein [Candidatus Hydrogenedens sp.]